jgi:hypothetical protein
MGGLIALALGIGAGTLVTRTETYDNLRNRIAPTEPGLGLDDGIDFLTIAAVALGVIMLVKRFRK